MAENREMERWIEAERKQLQQLQQMKEMDELNRVLAENQKLLTKHARARTVVRVKRLINLLLAVTTVLTLAAIWLPPHGHLVLTAGVALVLTGIALFGGTRPEDWNRP
jgi:ferric-dicitrate binding protein FerR (iron transport regulator)